jgi:hypothetical protein
MSTAKPSQDTARDEWVIAYLSLSGTPATNVIAFQLDPELGVLVHKGIRYDVNNAEEMAAFQAAQSAAFGCERYRHSRLRVLPVSFFTGALTQQAEKLQREEAARQEDAAIAKAEAERLASLPAPGTETVDEGEELEEEEKEVPPYEEWSAAELKAEAERRGIPIPSGKRKAFIIEQLELDDSNDKEI